MFSVLFWCRSFIENLCVRLHSGNKQGEHPEDDQSIGRGSQHSGSGQQTVWDPQLPTPGTVDQHTRTRVNSSHMFYCIFTSFLSQPFLFPSLHLSKMINGLRANYLSYCRLFYNVVKWSQMVFFLLCPSLSVPGRGDKGSDGVGAQGAVREAVSGLQHDLPAHEAGVHHSLRWEQLRLRVYLAWHPFQLRAGLWRRQEEARSVKKLIIINWAVAWWVQQWFHFNICAQLH